MLRCQFLQCADIIINAANYMPASKYNPNLNLNDQNKSFWHFYFLR